MSLKQWQQRNFIGGTSYADLLGLQDSFLYARALDVRTLPGSAILQKRMEPYIKDAVSRINAYAHGLFLLDSNKFYIGTTLDDSTLHTGTGDDDLVAGALDPVVGNGKTDYMLAGKKYLHRLTGVDISAGTASGVRDYKDLTNGGAIAESRHRALFTVNNNWYIGVPGGVSVLDSNETLTHKKLDLGDDTLIPIKFTYTGRWLKIWCMREPDIINGSGKTFVYFWDMVSAAYEYRARLDNGTAFAIETINGVDILAAETPVGTELFSSQGFGFQPLASFPAKIDIAQYDSVTQLGASLNGLFLFGFAAQTDTQGNLYDRAGVWSYGTMHPNISPVSTFDYPITKKDPTARVTAIAVDKEVVNGLYNHVLYIAWSSDTKHGVDKLSTTNYAGEGVLIGRMFDGADAFTEKDIRELALSFARPRKGVGIDAYIRTDTMNVDEIYQDTFGDKPVVSVTERDDMVVKNNELPDEDDGVFLQTKVVLKTENPKETPRLLGINVVYEANERHEDT